jgi:ubiquinone/menaquinone biosynthesis C-methylase UbiE
MKQKTNIVDKVIWGAYSKFLGGRGKQDATAKRVETVLEKLANYGARSNDKVLDAGCGAGTFTLALAAAGYRAVGVDFAPVPLAKAQENADKLNLYADFEKMDLDEEFWFTDGEFDHALCLLALHLLGRPEATLDEIGRVMKPGGLLAVSLWADHNAYSEELPETPSARMTNAGKRALATAGELSHRVRFWTTDALRDLLQAHNFEVLEISGKQLLLAIARKNG